MELSIDIDDHVAAYSNEIKEICKPLFQAFGITYFNYTRQYADGSCILLTTFPEWKRYYYQHGYYNESCFRKSSFSEYTNYYKIWDHQISQYRDLGINIQVLEDARQLFNLHHGLTVCVKYVGYCELFSFATTENNHQINEIFELHKNYFKKFIFFFKDQAADIIKCADGNRMIIPAMVVAKPRLVQEDHTRGLSELGINKYYFSGLNGDCYLTPRELECIKWSFLGKSAEEISIIMDISQDTAKCHLKNVKDKLGVSKLLEALRIISQQLSFDGGYDDILLNKL